MSAALLLLAGAGCGQPPPGRLVVRAGRLFDGSGAPAREHVRLTVIEGSIVSLADDDGAPAAAGELVLDARDATVLPGLINAHTHLFNPGTCADDPGTLAAGVRNLAALLRGGVTTVVDLGAPTAAALALRRWVGTGRGRGPRVLVSGPTLIPRGGYLGDVGGGRLVRVGEVVEVSNAGSARGQVRDLAEAGVDFIDLALHETSLAGTPVPTFDAATVCAVLDEAHTQKLRAAVHAISAAALTTALDCKADVIVHAPLEPISPELAARVARSGVPLAPTLRVWTTLPGVPPALLARTSRGLEASTRALREAGAHLALGTDGASCDNPLGSPVPELERLVALGMTPAQALVAATAEAARFAGLEDALGRLAVGYRADLVVIEGRPDERLDDLARVRAVVIDGLLQPLEGPRWWALPSAALERAWAWLAE